MGSGRAARVPERRCRRWRPSSSRRQLLEALLELERRLGRRRDEPTAERWGPRVIDLDLLLYGELVVDRPGLRVPHPRLHERRFALEPLAELAPEAVVPGHGTVSALLAALDDAQ